ncbi:GNAT family N-acetyltransferase [Flavobacteriales bacterium]|nr:GNAT family N-acetyltransferase [Flavobacteriales bacterium]
MIVERLPWDSSFFGFEIGRGLWTANTDKHHITSACQGFDLVYLNQESSPAFDSAKNRPEAFDAGVKLTFVKSLRNGDMSRTLPGNIVHLQKRTTELEQLALTSGHQSRYRLDPRFPDRLFEKLYVHWIRATIDGLWDASVLGFMQGNQLTGFITVEFPESGTRIGLVAVHPDAQGQGIGKQLIAAASTQAMRKGAKNLKVSTQGTNETAKLAYIKGGFVLHSTIQQYHWWNPNHGTIES